MDLSVYEHLNGYTARHEWLEEPLRFFAVDGQILFLAVLAALFLARGKYRSRNGRNGVAAAGLSAALALLVAQLIATVWDRARPYEAHPASSHLLLSPSLDPSFPSDHATGAFARAVAVGLRHRKAGLLTLALATLVSVGRVALGTHYPTDVLGGAALGALAALVFWLPPVRGPLHRLAERLGQLYERLIPLRRRQRQSTSTERRPRMCWHTPQVTTDAQPRRPATGLSGHPMMRRVAALSAPYRAGGRARAR